MVGVEIVGIIEVLVVVRLELSCIALTNDQQFLFIISLLYLLVPIKTGKYLVIYPIHESRNNRYYLRVSPTLKVSFPIIHTSIFVVVVIACVGVSVVVVVSLIEVD